MRCTPSCRPASERSRSLRSMPRPKTPSTRPSGKRRVNAGMSGAPLMMASMAGPFGSSAVSPHSCTGTPSPKMTRSAASPTASLRRSARSNGRAAWRSSCTAIRACRRIIAMTRPSQWGRIRSPAEDMGACRRRNSRAAISKLAACMLTMMAPRPAPSAAASSDESISTRRWRRHQSGQIIVKYSAR